ncbi:mediator of RNA polymerase II transcription subunit 13 [Dorcoceras hygrometricum]|uniref:Mediator of RNA polymerase II transcription subunit 13 n=1 Tax=Dorcoceras hygrometricum TaxID=472368 RepID=A0A2Z7AMK1_9LAMI|nr:mediator of RNA polymerase II transcription subunit 13 [Dorcoceras hygrometricum]
MFLVDWAVKMRIRPPEFETSICDAKYHVSLSTKSVLGKCVYLVTLAISLYDLQDVRIAIGSIATLDLPMVVDLIRIYGSKDRTPPPLLSTYAAAAARLRRKIVSGQFDEENPFVLISSVLLVQADEGVSFLVVDRIGDIYRNLPRRADVIVTTVGARHKCQQGSGFEQPMYVDNFVLISSVLLVQADEGVSFLVVDRIGDIYRNLPRRADVIVTTVGARHKCQQGSGFEQPMYVDNCY